MTRSTKTRFGQVGDQVSQVKDQVGQGQKNFKIDVSLGCGCECKDSLLRRERTNISCVRKHFKPSFLLFDSDKFLVSSADAQLV